MWNAVVAILLFGLAALCGGADYYGSTRAEGDTTAGTLIFAGGVVILVMGAIRVLVVGVIVTPDGLTVRDLFRTKKLPWACLRHTDVRRSGGGYHSNFRYYPTLHYWVPGTKAAETVMLASLGAIRREVAERQANTINELIQRRRTGLTSVRRRPGSRMPQHDLG
jgi:hypothetical protein